MSGRFWPPLSAQSPAFPQDYRPSLSVLLRPATALYVGISLVTRQEPARVCSRRQFVKATSVLAGGRRGDNKDTIPKGRIWSELIAAAFLLSVVVRMYYTHTATSNLSPVSHVVVAVAVLSPQGRRVNQSINGFRLLFSFLPRKRYFVP